MKGTPHWKPLFANRSSNGSKARTLLYIESEMRELIEYEKLAARRRESPLTMVVFDTRPSVLRKSRKRAFVRDLRSAVRTTDHLGQIETHKVAVLLPDTDARGAGAFVNKVVVNGYTHIQAEVKSLFVIDDSDASIPVTALDEGAGRQRSLTGNGVA